MKRHLSPFRKIFNCLNSSEYFQKHELSRYKFIKDVLC